MVTLISDGGTMTVGRRTASFTWGSFDVVLPDGTEQQEDDGRLVDGYIYRPDDRGRGRGELTFVRADARIDMNAEKSDLEDTLDGASRRTEGAIFYTREISGLGLGKKIPGVDYNRGDLVDVLVWGKRITLPVTGLRRITSTDRGRYDAVQVGGQALADPDRQRKLNSDLDRQIAAEKRQRLKEAGEIRDTADAAKSTADTAKQIAEQSKEASDAALTGTSIEYAVGTSEEFPPTSGWSTSTPHRPSGSFIWMRTRITYGSGQPEVTSPVLITGNTGAPGADGTDGTAGKDGLGIQSTVVLYAVGTSGTVAPTSGWFDQVPPLTKGQYLWTRTVWTYTDNSTETGHSVSYIAQDGNDGDDGLPGKDGVGIESTVNLYAVSSSGTVPPASGWGATPPAAQAGQFMWTRHIWTYTDGTTETGHTIGKIGNTGAKGDKGEPGSKGADGLPGKDGVGLDETVVEYALATSGTITPPTGWSTTVPTLVKGRYLWTRTTWTYSDNSTEIGHSVSYLATDGSDGQDGLPGKDGVGITDTVIEYARSTSGTTPPVTGWGAQPPITQPGDYVWTRHTWHYTDGTSEVGHTVGKIGDTGPRGLEGEQGIPGDPGVDGRPSYTHIAYADTASGAGFSQSPVGKAYMGVYVDDLPTDSSDPAKYRWSLIKGADGERGVPGSKGSDGRTPYFHTAWADSPDGVVGFSTTDSEGKRYLGTYTDYSTTDVYMDAYMDSYGVSAELDSTDPTRYTWVQIKGDKGDDGKGISSTVTAYVAAASGTTTPTEGWTTSIPVVPKGHFLWTRTTLSFTDGATSVSYAVSRQGVDGENGTPGDPGADGRTSYFHTAYANSADGVAGFSTTDPTGRIYVGTYSDFTEADSTDPSRYTWQLVKGTDGAPGKGVDTVTITYASSNSGTQAPSTGWQSTMPAVPQGHFLWTRTLTRFTDGATTTVDMVARQGVDGEKGTPGAPGHDGRTPFLHVAYANSADGTVEFSTTDPSGRAYLGTYTDFATLDIYSDVYTDSYGTSTPLDSTDPARYSWALIKGTDGADGISVAGMTIYYRLVSRDSPPPSRPTVENPSEWTTTEPDYQSGTTLYQVIKVTYSNGAFAYTDVSRVSAYMAAASAMELAEDGVKRAKDINAALTGSIDGDLAAAMADSGTAIGAVADAATTARDWTEVNDEDFRNAVALFAAAQGQVNDINLINWETQDERNALQTEIDEAQNVALRLQENAIKWSSTLAVRMFSSPAMSGSWTDVGNNWISIVRTPVAVSVTALEYWLGEITIQYITNSGKAVVRRHERTTQTSTVWWLHSVDVGESIKDVLVTLTPWKWNPPREFVFPYSRGGTAFDPVSTYDEIPYGPVRNSDSSYTFGFAVKADSPVLVLPSGTSTWFQYLAGARIGAGGRVLPVSYTDGPARRVVTFTEVSTE